MDFHRLAALLMGAWLAGCLFMDVVATQNFRSVDRLLAAPSVQLAERMPAMGGRDSVRVLLRHHVGEQNRWFFETWEWTQIGLGLVLLLVLMFGVQPDRLTLLLTLLMLAAVLLMHFVLTPQIIRMGRALDFAPVAPASGERAKFWVLHGAYSGCELVKLGFGGVLAGLLLRKKSEPAQVDAVHKSDHSHVDG